MDNFNHGKDHNFLLTPPEGRIALHMYSNVIKLPVMFIYIQFSNLTFFMLKCITVVLLFIKYLYKKFEANKK